MSSLGPSLGSHSPRGPTGGHGCDGVRALIWQLIPTELCPPPPVVSRPQSSVLFTLFGISDEPEAPAFITARGLDELPPSFSTEKAGRLMDAALRDAERQGEGHQHSAVSTLPLLSQTCLDHIVGALSAWGKSPFPLLLQLLGFDAKV
jgi:hypothetical protein